MDAYKTIPSWRDYKEPKLEREITRSTDVIKNLKADTTLKKTKCERGHIFFTSEALERGGHGCPDCLKALTGLDNIIINEN